MLVETLSSLPLPVAQVLRRAVNSGSAVERHNLAFYACEAMLKLSAAARAAAYLALGSERDERLTERLGVLAQPSLGHWVQILRETSSFLAARPDSAAIPLAAKGNDLRGDRPAWTRIPAFLSRLESEEILPASIVGAARRTGPLGFFDLLVAYRNELFGHGAQRHATYYEGVADLLLHAAAEVARDESLLGGLRLAVPGLALEARDAQVRVSWRSLHGMASLSLPDGFLPRERRGEGSVQPGHVYLVGNGAEIDLHPLVVFLEDSSGRERVGFLNRSRGSTRVEYLDYGSGEILRGLDAASAVARFLEQLRPESRPQGAREGEVETAAPPPAGPLDALPTGRPHWRPGAVVLAASLPVLAGLVAGWHYLGGPARTVRAGPVEGGGAPAAVVALRPALAVLPATWPARVDESGMEQAGLLLTAPLLAAGGEWRVVAAEEALALARMHDVEWSNPAALTGAQLGHLRDVLGTDAAVFVSAAPSGSPDLVRLELTAYDLAKRLKLAATEATGTSAQIRDAASRAAGGVREALGMQPITAAEEVEARQALPAAGLAVYLRGLALIQVRDLEKGAAALREAAGQDAASPWPRAALAGAERERGRLRSAEEFADAALARASAASGSARLRLEAEAHGAAGRWREAAEAWTLLFDGAPDDVGIGSKLAEAQLAEGEVAMARATLARLRQLPPPLSADPRIDTVEARALYRAGDFNGLLALAQRLGDRAERLGATPLRAQASFLRGAALQELGDPAGADRALEAARSLFSELADARGLARTLELMAASLESRGDLVGAERLVGAALAEYERLEDRLSVAKASNNLGMILRQQGRLEDADRLVEAALATFREVGAGFEAAFSLQELGASAQLRGDLAGARERYREALDGFTALGDRAGTATALTNLGEVHFLEGDLDAAERFHGEALALDRQLEDPSAVAHGTFRLGKVAAARGDRALARRHFEEAREAQRELGESLDEAMTRLALARLDLAEGRFEAVLASCREVEQLFRGEGKAEERAEALFLSATALARAVRDAEARPFWRDLASAAGGSDPTGVRLLGALARLELAGREGRKVDLSAARTEIEQTIRELERSGQPYRVLWAEVRLAEALGRAGVPTDPEVAGRLASEASRRGFRELEREARALGAGTPSGS